jgi:polyphosphate glucokinase
MLESLLHLRIAMQVLVIDVGGSHVKIAASGADDPRRFDSSPDLTPGRLVAAVQEQTSDWEYEVISLGYPGRVDRHGPVAEPGNLGNGWVGFDFETAFGVPVRIVNDAAMQALGAYDGGRMLFLGLGTGVGSTLITEHVVIPLELGAISYDDHENVGERLGRDGLEAHGEPAWLKSVHDVVFMLRDAMSAEYVVLGGGNAERVDPLPPQTRRGGNDDAFAGGFRIWEELVEPHDRTPEGVWRVVP